MIKPIEECHRIIQYEQKRRETIDRAFEAVKKDMPSEAQTRYNQRDIQKRNHDQWHKQNKLKLLIL